MAYKVFLVEDEIVAREGIRDNVDWASVGFAFCGEAPDGEMALPLIEQSQPDVLITDIKMPFMDGLQLSRLVKERMPQVKIIILSGHDEFNYAQAAVKLGVTEYMLKPVGVKDLHDVLARVAQQLTEERREKESLAQMKVQLENNRAIQREKFLLKLMMGGITPLEAIEQSRRLELDVMAACYQVVLVRIELATEPAHFDYHQYQAVMQFIDSLIGHNPDIFMVKKDMEELLLLMKGSDPNQLSQEAGFLTELLKSQAAGKTDCQLRLGIGRPQQRLGDIYRSFAQAMAELQAHEPARLPVETGTGKAELLKLDKAAMENYLRVGVMAGFDEFFDQYVGQLSHTALNTYLVKNYIFIDIILTTAKFVTQLGGVADEVIPEINTVETLLLNIKTVEQIRAETRKIFLGVLTFRDSRSANQYAAMIRQARQYIAEHFTEPELSLQEVADWVSLSPSHFSTVFSRETGETFKEYLTEMRINRAKELLRTTNLKSFEISLQVGYNDPHYFSLVFKKQVGLSPKEFRMQTQP